MPYKTFGRSHSPDQRWPVAWFNPMVLWQSAQELVSSFAQNRNLDRRELYGNFVERDEADNASDVQTNDLFEAVDLSVDDAGQPISTYSFDFVADTGDGGNATYAVASAVLHPSLTLHSAQGVSTSERSPLLILGGDLAYPGASAEEYQYRLLELFEGARHTIGTQPQYTVLSIPQNHDWFDNASTFHRYFVARNNGEFIGASTPQMRSYFATKLPHRWWVLGFDFALVGDLDRDQYESFSRLAGMTIGRIGPPQDHMQPGDNVILLYPEPYWVRRHDEQERLGYPHRYQRLEALLHSRGIRVRMRMAGDLHHYVREDSNPQAPDRNDMLVTCGAGGAFMHPTHARIVKTEKVRINRYDQDALTPDLRRSVCVGRPSAFSTASSMVSDTAQHAKAKATVLPSAAEKVVGAVVNQAERATQGAVQLTQAALQQVDLDEEFRNSTATKVQYKRQAAFPDLHTSRALSWGGLLALFKPAGDEWGSVPAWLKGNIMFALLLGVLYSLAAYTTAVQIPGMQAALSDLPAVEKIAANPNGSAALVFWLQSVLTSPLAVVMHLMIIALCAGTSWEENWVVKTSGIIHGIVHCAAVGLLYWAFSRYTHTSAVGDTINALTLSLTKQSLAGIGLGVVLLVLGTLVGGLLFGGYLTLMGLIGWLHNNAFSPLAVQDYKGFLRFNIQADGTLRAQMIGIKKIPKRWKARDAGFLTPGDVRPVWQEEKEADAAKWEVMDEFELKS